jgi:hypothetical protein
MNYKETIDRYGNSVRLFDNSDDAWVALTPELLAEGWRIGCFGNYENAHIKYDAPSLTCDCNIREKCKQCHHSWSPSLIESGWCIFCIQQDTRERLNEALQVVKSLYDYQLRISSPDTRWELPHYQRAREVMKKNNVEH